MPTKGRLSRLKKARPNYMLLIRNALQKIKTETCKSKKMRKIYTM